MTSAGSKSIRRQRGSSRTDGLPVACFRRNDNSVWIQFYGRRRRRRRRGRAQEGHAKSLPPSTQMCTALDLRAPSDKVGGAVATALERALKSLAIVIIPVFNPRL